MIERRGPLPRSQSSIINNPVINPKGWIKMAGIQLPGLFTGIDTGSLIQQLITADSGMLNQYKTELQTWTDRQTAVNDLETALGTLKTSVAAMDDASQLRAYTVTSSDESAVTADGVQRCV